MSETDLISDAVKQKLRRLLELRDDYATKDAAAKTAKQELDDHELDVYEMFEDAGYEGTINVPLGPPYGKVKFRARATHYAKIANPDELQEHYENRGMVEEVSAPRFVMKRLNTEVREIIDNNGKMPSGLTYYTVRGMTITRPK